MVQPVPSAKRDMPVPVERPTAVRAADRCSIKTRPVKHRAKLYLMDITSPVTVPRHSAHPGIVTVPVQPIGILALVRLQRPVHKQRRLCKLGVRRVRWERVPQGLVRIPSNTVVRL